MTLLDTAGLALKNLALHKFRSFLTSLGIIFGVAAVISMLSIGEGARRTALAQIRALGIENIRIRSQKPPENGQSGTRSSYSLSYGIHQADIQRLQQLSESVECLVPTRDLRRSVWAGTRKAPVRVIATTTDYLRVTDLEVAQGRFLADLDGTTYKSVCVLGAGARRDLFGLGPAMGQDVKVANSHYEVVGVLKPRASGGGSAGGGTNIDMDIYVPYGTFLQRFGPTSVRYTAGARESITLEVDELIIRSREIRRVENLARVVRTSLAHAHPEGDVEVVVPLELLRQREKTQRMYDIVLGSIAGISLLVGGIGIMNIMLASIVERTREIGTRRALGARQRDITHQFLVETVTLSVAGGLIGIVVGAAGGAVIPLFVREMQTVVLPSTVFIAFLISVMVGILSGFYPAVKASRMNPIEALRFE